MQAARLRKLNPHLDMRSQKATGLKRTVFQASDPERWRTLFMMKYSNYILRINITCFVVSIPRIQAIILENRDGKEPASWDLTLVSGVKWCTETGALG